MAEYMGQDVVLASVEVPAWRHRAVSRSTESAKLRAEYRIQRFLDAAQALIAENGSSDFTVQQVVERSRQSLRGFYQYFGGKHELLLALFEEAVNRAATECRELADREQDPLERLRVVVYRLFQLARPDPEGKRRPLSDFALELHLEHPTEVTTAYASVNQLLVDLLEEADSAGLLRPTDPARMASLILLTVMFSAQSNDGSLAPDPTSVNEEELWEFCLHGITALPPRSPTTSRPLAVVKTD